MISVPESIQVSRRAACGQRTLQQAASTGLEIPGRIFRINANLYRIAGWIDVNAFERRHLVGRLSHHPLDQIDARDFFGDSVLHLETRVHFEEDRNRR